jgi:iron complex outermembrane receptor protein
VPEWVCEKHKFEERYMKKGVVAATMTVATSLGLGCPLVAFSQASDNGQQNNSGTVPPTSPDAAQPTGEAPAAPADETTGIETVIVTARRTAEDPQKVPVAVTAFSDKDLQREQINTSQDLAGRIPSLVITSSNQTRNTESPTIRGQGATFGASPGVIIYYSEVPLAEDSTTNGQGGPGKYFDLANLQVLKGSQGTLFGRNTTGGAILLEPHKPDQQAEASIRGDLSNFYGKGLEGIVNVPINDELAVRFGAKFFEREGFTKDVATGEDYDSQAYRTFRLGVMWKPADGVQNYLLSYYTHSANNGSSNVINAINRDGLNYLIYSQAYAKFPTIFLPPTPDRANSANLGCSVVLNDPTGCGQSVVAAQQARGVRNVQLSGSPFDLLDTGAIIDTFSYQLSDALTLRNIASYSIYKHQYSWDIDGSALALDDINSPSNTNSSDTGTYTEELQLQGNGLDQRLKTVAGVYYENTQPQGPMSNQASQLIIATTYQTYTLSRRSYGPYAQATYDLGGLFTRLDGLNLTAGVRYSMDDTSGSATRTTVSQGTAPSVLSIGDRIKDEAPTYTVGLDYKIPTTLLYGKVSRGYKSGGFAPSAVNPAHTTFKPEFVMNYEVGHKSDFHVGDMPVRINSALYYTDYTDMQRTAGDEYQASNSTVVFGGATFNAGKAEVMGFETDATVQPFTGFTVTANYSLTYGKYRQYELIAGSVYPQLDCTGQLVSAGQTAQLACIPFQNVPKHQGSLSMRYQLPVSEQLGKMEGAVTYSYTDRAYSSAITVPEAEPGAWLDNYGLLNASLSWNSIYGSGFDVQLYGTNLTDRTYRITNSDVWTSLMVRSSAYGEPRIYGLQLAYHWGD